jgi:hypothetical protein
VGSASLTFSCSKLNVDPTRQPDVLGDFFVNCAVCGIGIHALIDVDARPGVVMVDLAFGPNVRVDLAGEVSEDGILGYSIFLADHDGVRVTGMDPIMTFPRRQNWASAGWSADEPGAAVPRTCCQDDAYTARVDFELPLGVSQLRLEIAPVTVDGPLPVGRLTQVIVDDASGAIVSSSARHSSGSVSGVLVAILSVVLATHSGWRGGGVR